MVRMLVSLTSLKRIKNVRSRGRLRRMVYKQHIERVALLTSKEATMRRLIWIVMLIGFTEMPAVYAQQSGGAPAAYTTGPLAPDNCGTPDAPKACRSTVPTHAVLRYHRQSHQPHHHRTQPTSG
jgi:hypothetical protein